MGMAMTSVGKNAGHFKPKAPARRAEIFPGGVCSRATAGSTMDRFSALPSCHVQSSVARPVRRLCRALSGLGFHLPGHPHRRAELAAADDGGHALSDRRAALLRLAALARCGNANGPPVAL